LSLSGLRIASRFALGDIWHESDIAGTDADEGDLDEVWYQP